MSLSPTSPMPILSARPTCHNWAVPLPPVMLLSTPHVADVMPDNGIKEAGATALAEALKANTALHTLDLRGMCFGLTFGLSLRSPQALVRQEGEAYHLADH